MMKIAIGADHGGFELKEILRAELKKHGIIVEDVGCYSQEAVDYPDYARAVAVMVSEGLADQGILICRTGLGMSMAANKFPRVRAALCLTPAMANAARSHNDANVLVFGSELESTDKAVAIWDAWSKAVFAGEDRHQRRVDKIGSASGAAVEAAAVAATDSEIYFAIKNEEERELKTLDLIASENYASRAVREAQGSVMTNKYAEGYPGKRYYNGCEFVDVAERLAIDRAKTLFGADHVNVQPHCGSAANMAVYFSVLQPGDTILAMSLAHGGHLTHGHKINFSGRFFNFIPYGVNQKTERIDYDEVAALALKHKPKLVVAGASAYSRVLEFKRLREIADSVGAMLMVDMAHIAGLIAAGVHPNPVPFADFVTTTTHKTLRGPRSGMVLCRAKYASELDKQVFPGLQGGPLMHTIAAKAVCFKEAMTPAFKAYQQQVVQNARTLSAYLAKHNLRIVSGGTDNHLMLVDLTASGITGKDASTALEKAGMIVNKNAIPFDVRPPAVTSGIRIGTPAVTTRGMKEPEMERLGSWIVEAIKHQADEPVLARIKAEVVATAVRFPVP
ncbi:MAG: ribose 5-phosphate isomerase B [bacterium]